MQRLWDMDDMGSGGGGSGHGGARYVRSRGRTSRKHQERFAHLVRPLAVGTVSIIKILIRQGFRWAVTAMLMLAVLLSGTSWHLSDHCGDHQDESQVDLGTMLPETDDDGGEFCFSCDCSCQTGHLGDQLTVVFPMDALRHLPSSEPRLVPDGVWAEIEPPPVRAS